MRNAMISVALISICGFFFAAARPTTAPSGANRSQSDGFVLVIENFDAPGGNANIPDPKTPKPAGKPQWSMEALAVVNHDFLSRAVLPQATTELSGSLRQASDGKHFLVNVKMEYQTPDPAL